MKSSTPFTGSSSVYDWISGFINMERGQSFRSFRLDRMKILAKLAGNPENCAPAIHCAGSKGKGSVTGMTSAILEAWGYSCGRYASPHVSDFRERISLGKVFFDEDIYRAAGNELKAVVDTLSSSTSIGSNEYQLFQKGNDSGEEPTFFELMTLWFFLCSRLAKVDYMAVETGMGGRLDATNILAPLVSIITLIELEHTDILGQTIKEIAGEKAGIIKEGCPVVVGPQKPEALEVFKNKTAETKSPFFYFPEWAEISYVKLLKERTIFSFKMKNPKDGGLFQLDDVFLSMHGEVQAANAGLSILALKTVFPDLPETAVRKGLESFSLPARFEKLPIKEDFIIDGAHTSRSVETCVKTFTEIYGKTGILIFGCAAGKDVKTIVPLFIPCFSKIIITTPGTFKKSNPEEVYKAFCEEAATCKTKVPEILFIPETEKALTTALQLAGDLHLPILGTGSFYLAGELRKKGLGIRD
jgi:dihydrofolate synthase/folylpolyglutamate synthase